MLQSVKRWGIRAGNRDIDAVAGVVPRFRMRTLRETRHADEGFWVLLGRRQRCAIPDSAFDEVSEERHVFAGLTIVDVSFTPRAPGLFTETRCPADRGLLLEGPPEDLLTVPPGWPSNTLVIESASVSAIT